MAVAAIYLASSAASVPAFAQPIRQGDFAQAKANVQSTDLSFKAWAEHLFNCGLALVSGAGESDGLPKTRFDVPQVLDQQARIEKAQKEFSFTEKNCKRAPADTAVSMVRTKSVTATATEAAVGPYESHQSKRVGNAAK